jgi:uronate dehydrogenase
VIFASSNHTVGFYRNTDYIDADARTRPDSFYGVSKCFGEQLASYYYDRTGLETVCLRIGSSFPEPVDPRMMVTWLSYDDLVEALRCSLFAQRVGFHDPVRRVGQRRQVVGQPQGLAPGL